MHIDFVRYVRAEKRLPEQGQTGEAHQPPLYYLLATAASLPAEMDALGSVLRHNPRFVWAGVGRDINSIYHTGAEAFPWHGSVLAIHLMRAVSVTSGDGEPQVGIVAYWQALAQPSQDYKAFVHLVDVDWEPFGQGDGYPVDGRFPTSAWRAGDLVLDPHVIQLTRPIVPGEYKLAMGWYLESTGERVPLLREGQDVGTVAETAPFVLPP